MEKKIFFAALFGIFLFLSLAISVQRPIFFATGNVSLNLAGNATEIRLFLNGLEGNLSLHSPSNVNITAIINTTGKTIFLEVNASGWAVQSNVTRIENISYFSEGFYNVTAWFPGDSSHTPSSITYFLSIAAVPPAPPAGVPYAPPVPAPPAPAPPAPEFRVDIVDYDRAEIIGTNLEPGGYVADLSGASQLPITSISMRLKERADHFKIIIENVSKPAFLPGIEEHYPLEFPYQYIKVTVIGASPEIFGDISMDFKVEQTWISENRIEEGSIGLYRFEERWLPVSVVRTGETDEYSNFMAIGIKAFSSYFVISGGKRLIAIPTLRIPSYVVMPMTYMRLALILFVLILIILASAGKRKKERAQVVS